MKASSPTTHLGNTELRRHHSILIEGGSVPRARVMDQNIIDRYLMRGDLTLGQHRAGEYLLHQAQIAGIWPTGVDWSKPNIQNSKPSNVPFRIFPYGRTIAIVRRRFGDFHAYLVQEVVCFDWDVSNKSDFMKCLQESLDWIAERRMNHVPLSRLRMAVQNRR